MSRINYRIFLAGFLFFVFFFSFSQSSQAGFFDWFKWFRKNNLQNTTEVIPSVKKASSSSQKSSSSSVRKASSSKSSGASSKASNPKSSITSSNNKSFSSKSSASSKSSSSFSKPSSSVTSKSSLSSSKSINFSSISQNSNSKIFLKSKFFQGDLVAENIKEGKTVVDIKETGLRNGKTLNDSSFAWKFINGLRQVGYPSDNIPYEISSDTSPSVQVLNRFQKVNSLSLSDKISNQELIKLDEVLNKREIEDARLAQSFPLTKNILTYSSREASVEHLGALFTIAFEALPKNLVEWSAINFLDYIKTQGPGGIGGGIRATQEGRICFPNLLPRFKEDCIIKEGNISLGSFKSDFDFVYTLLHEYAHYLDGGEYMYTAKNGTSKGIVNTDGYTAISYDMSSSCPTVWRFYKLKNPTDTKNEFVTNYAVGWTSNVDSNCRSSIEDFADSFAMYVLQGKIFRKLAENKPALATKYAWLKQNVFGGKEYFTGDIANIELVTKGLQQPYQQPIADLLDYTFVNPSFVWDYTIK